MFMFVPIAFFAAAIAVMAVIVAYAFKHAQQRREDLAALARQLDWKFFPQRDPDHDDHYAHFEIFRRGQGRAAFNTLIGYHTIAGTELPVKAGDFRYTVTTGSGKDRKSTTHTFSYLILHLPHQSTPDLLIRPENIFDKIAGVFSDRDIDFESEDFSKRFMVASPDRKFAYDVCHPRMIEYLLQTSPPAIDIENARLCLSDGTRTWTPDQFRWMLTFAEGFLDRWPDHVRSDLAART